MSSYSIFVFLRNFPSSFVLFRDFFTQSRIPFHSWSTPGRRHVVTDHGVRRLRPVVKPADITIAKLMQSTVSACLVHETRPAAGLGRLAMCAPSAEGKGEGDKIDANEARIVFRLGGVLGSV